jgi:hypothetical protein
MIFINFFQNKINLVQRFLKYSLLFGELSKGTLEEEDKNVILQSIKKFEEISNVINDNTDNFEKQESMKEAIKLIDNFPV